MCACVGVHLRECMCEYTLCVCVVYTLYPEAFTCLFVSPDYITTHGDSEHGVDLLMWASVLNKFK